MARPKKDNADYFSHDADMRNDAKIKAIRRKFGIEGYGVYLMLLEILTDKDFFKVGWDALNIELISADIEIDANKLKEIVNYLVDILKMFTIEDDLLYCEKLISRFDSLLSKRKRDVKPKSKELSTSKTPKKEITIIENPQSKVKESKVKDINNITTPKINFGGLLDFINTTMQRNFKTINKSTQSKFLARLKDGYTNTDIKNAIVNASVDKFHKDNNYKYLTPDYFSRSSSLDLHCNSSEIKKDGKINLNERYV